MKITTTLNRIKSNSPCQEGWIKLLTFLNKTKADDEELDLLTILESNGSEDCIWAFRCTDNHNSIYRHISADFAESVLYIFEKEYPNDNRPRLSIQAARDYADEKINKEELDAACAAAGCAAMDAASTYAIWAAATAAMDAASTCAIWAAASARTAARAARTTARADSVAALAAAASTYAAMAAARSARTTGRAASVTARDAELEKQKEIIIKYLS